MTYETRGLAHPLEVFVAVADTEHVTAAAERLGIPQPTVSRTMARLSADLGVGLLVRDGRSVRLTRQGRLLAEHAARALTELGAGIQAIRGDSDPAGGRVVFGFLHSMGPTTVPTLLRGFAVERPGVRVGLVQDAAGPIIRGVVRGRIDLALASPLPVQDGLVTRSLARQPIVALLPEAHRLAGRARLRVRDLLAEPMITMRPGYGVRTITDQLLAEASVRVDYAFESDEMSTAAGLVQAGLGVAILAAGNSVPGTVEIPLADRGAFRTIGLVWNAHRTLTPPVAAFRDHVLAEGPALFAPET